MFHQFEPRIPQAAPARRVNFYPHERGPLRRFLENVRLKDLPTIPSSIDSLAVVVATGDTSSVGRLTAVGCSYHGLGAGDASGASGAT